MLVFLTMNTSSQSRRDFLQTSLAATLLGTGLTTLAAAKPFAESVKKPDLPAGGFPADFAWGAATAAYQVEGAVAEDGRKPSIWDTFCQVPGRIDDASSGAIACDQYHRYESDVKLMAELGVKHYRFSLAWPRILPDGRGAVNEKGLDYYKRLIDCLGAHGITPYATLYHWDCPQTLEDEYGSWRSRRIADDFAEYAAVVGKHLGDRVQNWMTLNEISTFTLYCGYGVGQRGEHAPGHALARRKDQTNVTHHALLAHGRACQALRASSPGPCRVAIAEVPSGCVPVMETPEHIAAATKAFRCNQANGGILVPLLTGRYDPVWLEQLGAEAPDIREGDMATIGQPLDAAGINCYTGSYVRAANNALGFETLPMSGQYPKMHLPWLNFLPEAIYWVLRQSSELCGRPTLPLYVTENGCAGEDVLTAKGEVNDLDRLMYLRSYLRQVQRVIVDGYPVKGYFAWSIMDNFEWARGYSKRFGLIYVDYPTQRRIPKLSYRWMQQVIKAGRVL
jgi:beta-glucosidase